MDHYSQNTSHKAPNSPKKHENAETGSQKVNKTEQTTTLASNLYFELTYQNDH